MKPRTVHVAPMGLLPVGYRQRLRELSLGPIAWGAWSWTFQDGSCWAAVAFGNGRQRASDIIGWAAVTQEVDMLPVAGCFVDEAYRKQGVGTSLAITLLTTLRDSGVLETGSKVYVADWRWPKWHDLLAVCGMEAVTWE